MTDALTDFLNATRRLAATVAAPPGAVRVVLSVAGGVDIEIRLPSGAAAAPAAAPGAAGGQARELKDAILKALADGQPLKVTAVAHRLGYSHTSGHFRNVVKQMRDGGEIIRDADGCYVLPATTPDTATAGAHGLSMPSGSAAAAETDDAEPDDPGSRQEILQLLQSAGVPLKAATIARRLGRSDNGAFRRLLGKMCAARTIARTPDRKYRLADEGTAP